MRISLLQEIKIGISSSYSFNEFKNNLKYLFVTAICIMLENCKKYKNQYKKQQITYYH